MAADKNGELTCPPGYHHVRGHYRTCQSGKRVWIHQHLAKNPGQKATLPQKAKISSYSKQDLMELYNKSKRKFAAIGKICGFPENAQLDPMIQLWLEFWKQQGLKYPQDLTPRLIKAMIAKESSFNPNAHPKNPKMSARGLMQIKKDSWQFIGGAKKSDGLRELSNQHVYVSQDDLFDPLTNVACGIRWLARKYQLIPKKSEKNAFNTLKAYNNWNSEGEDYAKDIFEMANKKCP